MDWSARPDDVPCCPGPDGAVAMQERLARLLHTRNIEPDFDPLRRSEFFPKTGKPFSNTCGYADGCSVVRCNGLTENDVRQRCQAQADKQPGRVQEGALVATAHDLRSIRLEDRPDEQVVFIYDDPTDSEPKHAIIRGKETLSRPDQDFLREQIRKAFSERISP